MATGTIRQPASIVERHQSVGSGSIADWANSFASGGFTNWCVYTSSTSDAPDNYNGSAMIVHHSSNLKMAVAFSRSGKIFKKYKYLSGSNYIWGAWAEIT